MKLEEAQEWAYKYMSRNARKTHPDHVEMMRRTEYVVNKIYKELEAKIKEKDIYLNEWRFDYECLNRKCQKLEAKLKKYEEPVAKFKGTAFDECQNITLYSNDRGRLVVDMYMTLGMEDGKEYDVIIIEADK